MRCKSACICSYFRTRRLVADGKNRRADNKGNGKNPHTAQKAAGLVKVNVIVVGHCWYLLLPRRHRRESCIIHQNPPMSRVFANFFYYCHFFVIPAYPALFSAIPAKILVIPAFPVIPAQAGINSLQGGKCCGVSRVIDGDFISPSFPRRRESTLLPFFYARKRKRRFIAENGKPLRRQSRRKFPPPLAAQHTAAFSHLALQDGLRYAQIAKMRR